MAGLVPAYEEKTKKSGPDLRPRRANKGKKGGCREQIASSSFVRRIHCVNVGVIGHGRRYGRANLTAHARRCVPPRRTPAEADDGPVSPAHNYVRFVSMQK